MYRITILIKHINVNDKAKEANYRTIIFCDQGKPLKDFLKVNY